MDLNTGIRDLKYRYWIKYLMSQTTIEEYLQQGYSYAEIVRFCHVGKQTVVKIAQQIGHVPGNKGGRGKKSIPVLKPVSRSVPVDVSPAKSPSPAGKMTRMEITEKMINDCLAWIKTLDVKEYPAYESIIKQSKGYGKNVNFTTPIHLFKLFLESQ